MKEQLQYKDHAKYYDLIYSFKDYKTESEKLLALIKIYKKSDGHDLLEVACGTGKHLNYLKKHFKCVGIDINVGILNEAKKNIKGVEFLRADMRNFTLKKKFDVITCLFSSIGYVKDYKNLEKTIKCFSNHLKVGGVIIIESWFDKKTCKNGNLHMTNYQSPELCISRVSLTKIKGNISTLDMNYLVGEKGKEIKYYRDIHHLGLFDITPTLHIMNKYGLKTKFIESAIMKGRGTYIGVKK